MLEDLNMKMMQSGGAIREEDKNKFIEIKEQFEANQRAMIDEGKINIII